LAQSCSSIYFTLEALNQVIRSINQSISIFSSGLSSKKLLGPLEKVS